MVAELFSAATGETSTGNYKEVVVHPLDEQKVLAKMNGLSDLQTSGMLHLNRILHLLFPKHIPQIGSVWNEEAEGARSSTYMAAERIPHDLTHHNYQRLNFPVKGKPRTLEQDGRYNALLTALHNRIRLKPVLDFRDAMLESGMIDGETIDFQGKNFIMPEAHGSQNSANMEFYYIDLSPPWREYGETENENFTLNFNAELLGKKINALKNSSNQDESERGLRAQVEFDHLIACVNKRTRTGPTKVITNNVPAPGSGPPTDYTSNK